MKPYQQPRTSLEQLYKTDSKSGLSSKEATLRLATNGPNVLADEKLESIFMVFLRQFQSSLIYILVMASVLIYLLGNHQDAFIISGVLIFNAIIGTIQEGRARSILQALKKFAATTTVVLRDNAKIIIDDTQLVVGDIIVLSEGQKIPADARILEAHHLAVDESIFTGESTPVRKDTKDIAQEKPLFEQTNMLFKGTTVTSGKGHAIIVATGQNTHIGALQKTLEKIDTETPLKKTLDKLSHWIIIGLIGICSLLLIIGMAMGKTFTDLLIILTALFICAVPECLPVVLTLILLGSVFRMAKKQILVKRLQAVEGLGRTDVIIIDKTGTLTHNEMTVLKVVIPGKQYTVSGDGYEVRGVVSSDASPIDCAAEPAELCKLRDACALLNNANIQKTEGGYLIKGDPTEAAMGVLASKLLAEKKELAAQYEAVYEVPFSSQTGTHIAAYRKRNSSLVMAAGSPEKIEKLCARTSWHEESHQEMLAQKLRVIAIAWYESTDDMPDAQQLAGKCSLIGLIGMQDAIRKEVNVAIAQAQNAGIKIVMATGDHAATAAYVAQTTGIATKDDIIVEGHELKNNAHLDEKIDNAHVFARVTPEDKLMLVRHYQQKNMIVAMTGDGINDAPSLVAADIGIAMGKSGTDLAKEAADMILMNDSFESIVHAIEEGRHSFYTIRRVALYFFTTNLSEVFIIALALVFNMPLPLLAPQILWLNLITDGFLDVALSQEPPEKDLLTKSWLKNVQKKGLLYPGLIGRVLHLSLPMTIGSLVVFALYSNDLAKARTLALTCMALFQWFNAWNCRSETTSVFKMGIFSNIWLALATVWIFFLHLCLIYLPFMQGIFHTVPLTFYEWIMLTGIASSIIILEELRKLITAWLTDFGNKSTVVAKQ